MKILIVLVILLISSSAFAGPFLVCDPQTGVTSYKLTGPAWTPTSVAAQPDGSLRVDLAGANVGSNSLTIKACITDAIWGEACSSSVPFVFSRPASPTIPANIKLTP